MLCCQNTGVTVEAGPEKVSSFGSDAQPLLACLLRPGWGACDAVPGGATLSPDMFNSQYSQPFLAAVAAVAGVPAGNASIGNVTTGNTSRRRRQLLNALGNSESQLSQESRCSPEATNPQCMHHNVCYTCPRLGSRWVLRRFKTQAEAGACVENTVIHYMSHGIAVFLSQSCFCNIHTQQPRLCLSKPMCNIQAK